MLAWHVQGAWFNFPLWLKQKEINMRGQVLWCMPVTQADAGGSRV